MWQVITIDDMLPVTESNSFVFTRSQKKQLFASLIEKALAKMHGSYKALECGMRYSFFMAKSLLSL
jgi:calpain-15